MFDESSYPLSSKTTTPNLLTLFMSSYSDNTPPLSPQQDYTSTLSTSPTPQTTTPCSSCLQEDHSPTTDQNNDAPTPNNTPPQSPHNHHTPPLHPDPSKSLNSPPHPSPSPACGQT